jgi:cytidyltransferase-like protein
MPLKYGVILGRMQPMHLGHQHIIDKIIADGLEPIVILGSAQEFGTNKNPYHPLERIHMVQLVYPGIKVFAIDDCDCWDEWYYKLISTITLCVTDNLDEVTIYLHDKLEDLQNFTFRGVDYTNEYYSKLYKVDGMYTTKLQLSDIQVRAKLIREDLEGNKHFLHPKVYDFITTKDYNAHS